MCILCCVLHIRMPLWCAALAAPSGYGGVVLNIFFEDGRQEAQDNSRRLQECTEKAIEKWGRAANLVKS